MNIPSTSVRTVVVKMSVEMVITVPDFSDQDYIEFLCNESSGCANNMIDLLHNWIARRDTNCICGAHETVFVREASLDDHWSLPLAVSKSQEDAIRAMSPLDFA